MLIYLMKKKNRSSYAQTAYLQCAY
ncbi:protein of unknown function [Xenorhabdus poinarii G6]|uniref:Uncharacterized protein n=1 Tax=Xenorhabdus poinarii G6 TaxID=1354304 RepID=A0A068QZP8_9GAMM|nr:protein of unknown function [Xenorhabdus poinarii G6]